MIRITNDKCDFCGTCVAMCPPDAIELAEARYWRHYSSTREVAEKICRRKRASFMK